MILTIERCYVMKSLPRDIRETRYYLHILHELICNVTVVAVTGTAIEGGS